MTLDPRAVRTVLVVLTGPECSGKTTLASELAARFDAPWTVEASRQYAESSPEPLSAGTVGPIARLSMRLEDDALASDPPLLVRDTDLVSTVVYAHHYYGECPDWIVAEARARRADLYLLCVPDLPWSHDGVRDRPDGREQLFDEFARALQEIGARVDVIRGDGQVRTDAAVHAVRAMLPTAANPATRGRGSRRTP